MKRLICLLFIAVTSNIHGEIGRIIPIEEDLRLKPLGENIWIHISDLTMEKWGKVSANGMVVVADECLYLIDTPWNDRQTRQLVEWFQRNYNIQEIHVIVGHFHDDNLGGLGWINRMGYNSYSIKRTREICREKGLPLPQNTLGDDYTFESQEIPIEVHFMGEGHTEDSICAYLPEQKILFGGCSVKALENRGLGNIADANLAQWPATVKKMKEKYADALLVIPGHGPEGDISLLDHTLSLLEK